MMKCYGVGKVAGLGTVIILEDMGWQRTNYNFGASWLFLINYNLLSYEVTKLLIDER